MITVIFHGMRKHEKKYYPSGLDRFQRWASIAPVIYADLMNLRRNDSSVSVVAVHG